MKVLNRILLIFLSFLIIFSVEAQSKRKYKIQLVDRDGNSVEFFLTGNKETLLKSNTDGVLHLTKNQLRKYEGEKFTLHFSNHLAYLVYRLNLYIKRGIKSSDPHIKYNQISIEELTPKNENTFYLRRKEIRLDDEIRNN